MKPVIALISACVLAATMFVLGIAAVEPASPPTPQLTWPCKVLSAHDGDTCTVEVKLILKARLIECWAPELDEPGGLESQKSLDRMTTGKNGMITVPLYPSDLGRSTSLSRVLCRLVIDGEDIGKKQVAAGMAKAKK